MLAINLFTSKFQKFLDRLYLLYTQNLTIDYLHCMLQRYVMLQAMLQADAKKINNFINCTILLRRTDS